MCVCALVRECGPCVCVCLCVSVCAWYVCVIDMCMYVCARVYLRVKLVLHVICQLTDVKLSDCQHLSKKLCSRFT